MHREDLPQNQISILQNRLNQPERHIIPKQAQGSHGALVALFVSKAEAAQASVTRLQSMKDIPSEVAQIAAGYNYPALAHLPQQCALNELDWPRAQVRTTSGTPTQDCPLGVTDCFAGIAESGTIMVHSGQGRPHALNLVPDTLIVVVTTAQIIGAYEDAFDLARQRFQPHTWPRIVSWITGPSRTADIAGIILFGAHGSRRAHILLVDSDDIKQQE